MSSSSKVQCIKASVHTIKPAQSRLTDIPTDLLLTIFAEHMRLLAVSDEERVAFEEMSQFDQDTLTTMHRVEPDILHQVCKGFYALVKYRVLVLATRDAFFAECADRFAAAILRGPIWKDQNCIVLMDGRAVIRVYMTKGKVRGKDTGTLYLGVEIHADQFPTEDNGWSTGIKASVKR
jgi:hypothetical protein